MSLKKGNIFLSILKKLKNSDKGVNSSESSSRKSKFNLLLFPIVPILGLLSLVWFLVRVIPKPSRATYPCQRAAFPLASGFIIWLFGLGCSAIACKRASKLFARARYAAATICLIAGVSFVWMMFVSDSNGAPPASDPPIPNQPIGVGRGINPGRVVWMHNADAATWPGGDNITTPPYWHSDHCTDPQLVSEMFSKSLRTLAGTKTDAEAWDAMFRNFNQQMGRGDIGYQPGQKIAIKVNFVLTRSSGTKGSGDLDQIDNSPQLTIALLNQLVNEAGVNPGDISIGDPYACMPDYWYNQVEPNCPGIVYLTQAGISLPGRTQVQQDYSAPFYWSDPETSRLDGMAQDYIPTHYSQSDYFINFAILKSHTQNGMTATAKNHFGSIRLPTKPSGYYNMHHTRAWETPGMGHYRCLVDFMSHPKLGGKTFFFLVDGLYGGRGWNSRPIRYNMEPFNGDWPSSIFMSQDGVAIDSVAYDFLRTEFTDYHPDATEYSETNINGYPQMSGTEDFLHEAALAYNPPSGTTYDPAHDGGIKESLGVHEHWNNAIEKQYTRNLGTGLGIELVVPTYTSENGPVHNVTRDEKYDLIQDAIARASDNDYIVVSEGTYEEDIDFSGKTLTITSSDPNDPAIVASTIIKGTDKAVTFANNEKDCVLDGFTITGANTAVFCNGNTTPTISKCVLIDNEEYGIELLNNSSPIVLSCQILCNNGYGIGISASGNSIVSQPKINNCVIAANRLNGIECRMPTLTNCTIANNGLEGVSGNNARLYNSIVYYNNGQGDQIDSGYATIKYSNIQGNWTGTGVYNIDIDPCFAENGSWDDVNEVGTAGDYHLLSTAGRWVPSYPSEADPNVMISCWMTDEVSSPCIDAADPNASFGDELWPHGQLLNMGAYGGTAQASLSSSDAGDIRDIDCNDVITLDDASLIVDAWNSNIAPIKEDLNLDGIINTNDLAFFDGNWENDSNNVVPVFDVVDDVNVTTGELVDLSVAATDTDGDDLTYLVAGLPDGAVFDAQELTWTPELEGEYVITFIVSDNKSLSYITVIFTVEPEVQVTE